MMSRSARGIRGAQFGIGPAGLVLAAAIAILQGPGAGKARAQGVVNEHIWLGSYANEPGDFLDLALASAVSPDGTKVFVTRMSVEGPNPDPAFATVAFDSTTGERLWVARYNGVLNCTDSAEAIAVSPDGRIVFVTGYSGCITYEDYVTAAYDAETGAELWLGRYDGTGAAVDYATAIAVAPDGTKVFVTGYSDATNFIRDYGTVAYDAVTGRELWVMRYDGPGNDEENDRDEAYGIAVSPDSRRVFVTGLSDGGSSGFDYATLAYDALTGRDLWLGRHDGPAGGFDVANDLDMSPDGTKVFVTGFTDTVDISTPSYTTVAYRVSSGETLWVRDYDGPARGNDSAHAVRASTDGTMVFVTGISSNTESSEFPFDFATLAYGAEDGADLWIGRYNGSANRSDWADAVAVSPDGTRVYVTGYSYNAETSFDYTTVAYPTKVAAESSFRRADCNHDGAVDISDPVFTLGSLFLGEGEIRCADACDANDDGAIDISDAISTLGVLFLGQGEIPLPGAESCGPDPTDDEAECTASCP